MRRVKQERDEANALVLLSPTFAPHRLTQGEVESPKTIRPRRFCGIALSSWKMALVPTPSTRKQTHAYAETALDLIYARLFLSEDRRRGREDDVVEGPQAASLSAIIFLSCAGPHPPRSSSSIIVSNSRGVR